MTDDEIVETALHFAQVWNIVQKEIPSPQELKDAAYKYAVEIHPEWSVRNFEFFVRVLETKITTCHPAGILL